MTYAPAKKALRAGCKLALASDYNPGSSPSGDMRFVWALGCIKMKLTPEEALRACTLGGAQAMGIERGQIRKGMRADFILTRPIDSLAQIPYNYTTPYISQLFLNGSRL